MRKAVWVALILVAGWTSGRAEVQQTTTQSGVPEMVLTYFQHVEGHRFDEFLHGLRPRSLSPEVKEQILKILPRADILDASAAQQAKLRALAPILRYHDRDSAIDVTLLRARPATLAFLAGAAILITEPALEILSAEELQAAVAHELGHEYFWDEFELARQQTHYTKLQELELRCDGIAVIALNELALNPENLIRAVKKLNRYNGRRGTDTTVQRYVSLKEREGFVLSMIAMVRGGQVHRSPPPPPRVRARPIDRHRPSQAAVPPRLPESPGRLHVRFPARPRYLCGRLRCGLLRPSRRHGRRVLQVVGLAQPVGQRRLDFVAMPDLDEVRDLRLRRRHGAADPRRAHRAAEEDAQLEEAPLGADERVAGPAREHDRVVRGVDALLAQLARRLAQALPRLPQILG
jgi:hypothetical protein